MTDPTPNRKVTHRSKRWSRISLRLLLTGITLCSIWFAWLASTTKRQKSAISKLTQNGGYVTYSGDTTGSNTHSNFRAKFLFPLTRYVDADLLLPVAEVRTHYLEEPSLRRGATYASSDVINILADLPSVERVRLTHSEVRNEHLVALSGLKNIRHLDLSMTRLHEGHLDPIGSLDLVSFCVSRTRVDDDGLKCLSGMMNLEHLDLTRTKVTGHGLRCIESLPKLKMLRIQRSLVDRDDYERFMQIRPDVTVKWSVLAQ